MINQRIEMKLLDETLLIAETTENSDYPIFKVLHTCVYDGRVDMA